MVASGRTRFYPNALMLWVLRLLVRIYQVCISPLLGWLGGPATGCRFQPTCSKYCIEALETHGCVRGSWLTLRRLGRCHPWGGSGPDPVPPAAPTEAAVAKLACE